MCWVARAEKELVRCCDLNIIYFLDEIHNMHINSKFNINSQLGYYTIKDLGVVYNALLAIHCGTYTPSRRYGLHNTSMAVYVMADSAVNTT